MFERKGDKPRWQMVYEGLRNLKVGDIVSYEVLSRWAGVDMVSTVGNRQCVYDAMKVLQREDKRTIINVRGVGFRIAHASEHIGEGQKHRLKGYRQLVKAHDKVAYVDHNHLTAEESRTAEERALAYSKQAQMLRGLERRQDRSREALEASRRAETERLQEERRMTGRRLKVPPTQSLESMEQRLARLERLAAG